MDISSIFTAGPTASNQYFPIGTGPLGSTAGLISAGKCAMVLGRNYTLTGVDVHTQSSADNANQSIEIYINGASIGVVCNVVNGTKSGNLDGLSNTLSNEDEISIFVTATWDSSTGRTSITIHLEPR